MSSIVDYSSLSAAVANWMARSGNSDFISNVQDFIAFAENMFNYGYDDGQIAVPPLRVSQMEVPSTTLNFANSTNTTTLPSDFLEPRRLYMTGTPNQKLTYVTPNQADSALATFPAGPQAFYTIMSNQIVLPANVQTSQSAVLGYYQAIPPLSSSNTVNWLVQNHPGMYLAATCLHGAIFIGDDEEAARWARLVTGYSHSFQKQDLRARFNGDSLQMKTDVGNP